MTQDTATYIRALAGKFSEQGLSFSIHRKIIFGDGQYAIPGQVCRDLADAVQSAHYWALRGHDTYLAMGGQVNAGEANNYGFKKAIRKRYNIGQCSALYLDIDVKADGYTTQTEGLAAVRDFIKSINMPKPNMIVSSGTGGFHVYWVMDELFTPAEFTVLASSLVNLANAFGLKFDQNCTNDVCRLLRVPDTYNFKTNPASPVKLMYYSESKVSLAEVREKLKTNNVVPLRPGISLPPDDNDDLMQQRRQYAPVNIDLVATFCEFTHNTLMAGGANLQGEPQWHLAMGLAAHCEDGEAVAHRLCEKHHHYSHDDTTIKFYEAVNTRANNPNVGPPKCDYIQKQGITECATCPYFKLNTTPLNVPAFNAKPTLVPSVSPNSDLPPEYYRDKDACVWIDSTDITEGKTNAVVAFPYPVLYGSAFMENGDNGYMWGFTTLEGNGRQKILRLPMTAIVNKDSLSGALLREGVAISVTNEIRKFAVALTALLRSSDSTLMTAAPLGWNVDFDGTMGFSYNGVCHYPGGKNSKTRRLDRLFLDSYCVSGELKYWDELSKLIISQDRPDMNLIIACGFAAPLIALTGHSGLAVGVWSGMSGIGKSTGLALAQSIWGSTSRMQGLDDTQNQAIDTLATLHNLPCCWDELKGTVQAEKMANIIFGLSRGREKGRLTRNAEQARQRDFETLLVWTTNIPLADTISRATRGTVAGYYRIMEFHMDEGYISTLDVGHITNLVAMLRKNHGHIGELYATYLGENYLYIKDLVDKMRTKIDLDLTMNQSERFWSAGAACLLVGAMLSNYLKFANFNLPGLKQFIYTKIGEFRHTAKNTDVGDLSRQESVEVMLGEILHTFSQNTVKTDNMITGTGRPARGSVKVLNENINFTRMDIHVQIAQKNLLVRVADNAIGEWAKRMGMAKSAVTSSLTKHLTAVKKQGRIASGTDYATPTIYLWEIDLSNTDLGRNLEF